MLRPLTLPIGRHTKPSKFVAAEKPLRVARGWALRSSRCSPGGPRNLNQDSFAFRSNCCILWGPAELAASVFCFQQALLGSRNSCCNLQGSTWTTWRTTWTTWWTTWTTWWTTWTTWRTTWTTWRITWTTWWTTWTTWSGFYASDFCFQKELLQPLGVSRGL